MDDDLTDRLHAADPVPGGGSGASDVPSLLGDWARRIGAVAIAFYETGYSLGRGERTGEAADWTRLLYLVASYPERAPGGTAPDKFPSVLPVSRGHPLEDVIDADGAAPWLVDKTAFTSLLVGGVAGARCAMAVGAGGRGLLRPVLLFLFPDDAARARAHAASGAIALDLAALHDGMSSHAASTWFDLLGSFQTTLTTPVDTGDEAGFDRVVQDAIGTLAGSIRCPDVRVYLQANPTLPAGAVSGDPGPRFRLVAASTAGAAPAAVFAGDEAPLNWVLKHGRVLAMHNRIKLEARWVRAQTLYPGLGTVDHAGIDVEGKPGPFLAADAGECPSLLIQPIRMLGRTVGALLCSGRTGPARTFRERDEQGIGLIARMVGNQWFNRAQQASSARDQTMLARAVLANSSFNTAVNARLRDRREEATSETFIELALSALDAILDVPTFSSARLPQPDGAFVFSAIRHGERWQLPEVRALADKAEFRITAGSAEQAGSAAEYVFRSRAPVVVDAANPPEWYQDTFRQYFCWALFIPVFRQGGDRRMLAILDLRSGDPHPLPPSLNYVAQNLAEQLGFILTLAEQQHHLRQRNETLRQAQESQLQAFSDLDHQILSPHRTAVHQLERALRLVRRTPELRSVEQVATQLHIARGQVRRSTRVGRSAGLFWELARNGHIRIQAEKRSTLAADAIDTMIRRLLDDERQLADPARRLKFVHDTQDLAGIYRNAVTGDEDLLEQALATLIENAGKYALFGTTISVVALRDANENFILSVENFGYAIHPDEVDLLKLRGMRGREASARVSSGRGIGLWLANAIMISFGGKLEINIGNGSITPHRFRLVFPSNVGG
jgi:signal transduction histidine kinase